MAAKNPGALLPALLRPRQLQQPAEGCYRATISLQRKFMRNYTPVAFDSLRQLRLQPNRSMHKSFSFSTRCYTVMLCCRPDPLLLQPLQSHPTAARALALTREELQAQNTPPCMASGPPRGVSAAPRLSCTSQARMRSCFEPRLWSSSTPVPLQTFHAHC